MRLCETQILDQATATMYGSITGNSSNSDFPVFFCDVSQIEYNQAFDESGPGMYKKGSLCTPPDVTCSCQGRTLLLALDAFGAHLASQGGELDSGLSFPLVLMTLGALLRTQKEIQTHIYHVFSLTFQGLFVTTLRDGNSKPSISKMLPKMT